jgi:hypothetical protein
MIDIDGLLVCLDPVMNLFAISRSAAASELEARCEVNPAAALRLRWLGVA